MKRHLILNPNLSDILPTRDHMSPKSSLIADFQGWTSQEEWWTRVSSHRRKEHWVQRMFRNLLTGLSEARSVHFAPLLTPRSAHTMLNARHGSLSLIIVSMNSHITNLLAGDWDQVPRCLWELLGIRRYLCPGVSLCDTRQDRYSVTRHYGQYPCHTLQS